MNFKKIKEVLKKESKLIKIKKGKKIIFAGDTHGDLEASEKVLKDYLKPGNIIVFLGDYVDRGPLSKENLDFLLEAKLKNPKQIYLLQGNHEGYHILRFSPAEFWEGLSKEEYKIYTSIVENFPLVFVVKNIIALHGVPPDVESLKEINDIKLGSEHWQEITWGDFFDRKGEYLGIDRFSGRPQFGKEYFFKIMKRFDKDILIRSHQSDTRQFLFDDKCLTIFTSFAYTRKRTIAIADLSKEIKSARDLEIKIL